MRDFLKNATSLTAALAALSISVTACASAWLAHGPDAPRALDQARTGGNAWQPIEVAARPVGQNSNSGTPAPLTVGKLKFAGAVVLTSPSSSFGGFSGMRLSEDGETLYAISDRAKWLKADVVYNDYGAISALNNAALANLTSWGGEIITGTRADAEALELTPDGAILGFEREHRLDYYEADADGAFVVVEEITPRDLFSDLPSNSSFESVALLRDGRIVTLAEGATGDDDTRTGWLSPPGILPDEIGDWAPFRYLPADEYSPTDMVQDTETGDVYLVERAFSNLKGVRARITRIAEDALKPSVTIEPEELALLNAFHGVDNMEGIDLRYLPDGRLMIYLISDDNFNMAQRTVLMSWEVTDRRQ